jgi:two-component system LytT family sensor kinase
MPTEDLSTLVHLVGFVMGTALYAMLGVMALRSRGSVAYGEGFRGRPITARIAIATAALGVTWNLGGLFVYGVRDLGPLTAPTWSSAIAFAALGFLPAVVIHAASANLPRDGTTRALVGLAYLISAGAAGTQLEAALVTGLAPSRFGLRLLSVGYALLTAALALRTSRRPGWRRGLSTVALAAFAVMAMHLSLHAGTGDRWWVELVGHHASIPLAVAILYQDYRFAFADQFLKRVLAVVAILTITLTAYLTVVAPFLIPRLALHPTDPRAVAALAILWILVAVSYPVIRLGASRFVDKVLLRRADYRRVQSELAARIADLESEQEVLDATCRMLGEVLWAPRLSWTPVDRVATEEPLVTVASREGRQEARVTVAAAEHPAYVLNVAGLSGGRVLLSDDLRMLEAASGVTAHRINAIRLTRERTESKIRENEILQLATEAELRALRARLNPHFLFNALTTIGHLMSAAPDRALETLYRLTDLLRAVLRRSDGPFVTLGEEIEIVEAYLAIESARFEERLRVTFDVPEDLTPLPVPPLILQPLVENAVKHGIAPKTDGGSIVVTARRESATAGSVAALRLSVVDTGIGANAPTLARRRAQGFGLSSVERRLERHFGETASLSMRSAPDVGTSVEIRLPIGAPPCAGEPEPREVEVAAS